MCVIGLFFNRIPEAYEQLTESDSESAFLEDKKVSQVQFSITQVQSQTQRSELDYIRKSFFPG
jgi:hypothetical protein